MRINREKVRKELLNASWVNIETNQIEERKRHLNYLRKMATKIKGINGMGGLNMIEEDIEEEIRKHLNEA